LRHRIVFDPLSDHSSQRVFTRLPTRIGTALAVAVIATLCLVPAGANAAVGPPVITSTFASNVGETAATLNGALDPNGSRAKAHFEYLTEAEYAAAGNTFTGAEATKDIIVENQVEGTGSSESGSSALRGVSATKGTFVAGQLIKATGALPTGTTINAVEADPSAPGKQILYLSKSALESKAGASFTATGGAAAGGGNISFESDRVKNLTTASGTFTPGQSITGPGIPANTTIADVFGPTELRLSKTATETATGVSLTAASGQPVSAAVEGLAPQTKYLLRLVAERTNGSEQVSGPTAIFYTLAPVPSFENCPANEPFRSGAFAPFGHPSDALPDCRVYEQASPLNKNGGDVLGEVQFSKAADDGSSVTFGSSFGVPGAEGAQERPFYLASRGADGWSTTGLMPPPSAGDKAQPLAGWSPNLESSYAIASRPREGFTQALFELHRDGSPPIQITPFALREPHGGGASYFAGISADRMTVLAESFGQYSPAAGRPPIALARENAYNVYAWDRGTEELHLASVLNTPEETEELLPKGAFAGPYDWMHKDVGPRSGGAGSNYYLRDERAVSTDGSVFFTAAGTGQLYQRLHPTAQQSNPGPNGYLEDGHCYEPDKACTIHISATEKTNGGPAEDGPDPAGSQPAAFQAASADGSVAYFTSSEKLTNDANTGPEQLPAQIERDDLAGSPVEKPGFLPQHAIGVAVDAAHVYWADPTTNAIGRADLNGENVDPSFISPGQTKCKIEVEEGVFETKEEASHPRYVAVDSGHVYWTNTGCSNEFGAIEGTGTIGRADINGTEASVKPEFITGASNPQGIAVNAMHVYWANAGKPAGIRAIGQATIEGEEVAQNFFHVGFSSAPSGLALSSSHIYFGTSDGSSGYVMRIPLNGPEEKVLGIGQVGVRGLAVDGSHVYWADQAAGEEAIGRADLDLENPNNNFIPLEGKPNGLAVDAAHLYWSTNGEAPTNPGNDLYRYQAAASEPLRDLVADSTDPSGAEVKGVIGSSTDGSYLYFVANGDLDGSGPAEHGNCSGSTSEDWNGRCPIYLWHEGETQAVGVLQPGAEVSALGDGLDWASTPVGLFGQGAFVEKTSFVSPDGLTLVFRSQVNQLTGEAEGEPQYYRYRIGSGTACLTCAPSGFGNGRLQLQSARVGNGALAASFSYAVESHHLAEAGNRFFFESTAALVSADVNGLSGCKDETGANRVFLCQDVYEWEAPGSGTCTEGGPAYSPLNQGCIYLISTGKSKYPSFFVDASASGNDVFFLTRDQLVGQDTDSLQDVYDARVNGGLEFQNQPPPIPCENEGCKNEGGPPPQFSAPPQISGPGNPPIKRKPCKPKKGKKACGKKHKPRHHKRHHHKGAKR
jgi:sugar lactone lactonase YvrE